MSKKIDLAGLTGKSPKTSANPLIDFFKPANELEMVRGIKLAVQGESKVGKSHFGMSCPPPVFMIDLELGDLPVYLDQYSGAAEYKPQFPNEKLFPDGGKEIYIMECLELDKNDDIDYTASIQKMLDALKAMVDVKRGTVVLDSATLFWKWAELKWKKALYGSAKPGEKFKFQFDWGPPTEEYFRVMMRLMAKPIHLVMIGHEKAQYGTDGKPIPGLYEGKWQPQTPHWAHMTLRLWKTPDPTGPPQYGATITKSRYSRALDERIDPVSYLGVKKYMEKRLHTEVLDYPNGE
ncbi:MAG: AAA family ATPase [Candidatus Thorarchaeota archaeon]|jgi:hypothetical protein